MRLLLAYSGKTDGDRLKEYTSFYPQQRFYSNIEYYHNKREQNGSGYAFGARASSKCRFVCTWLVIPCFFTFPTFCVSSFFCTPVCTCFNYLLSSTCPRPPMVKYGWSAIQNSINVLVLRRSRLFTMSKNLDLFRREEHLSKVFTGVSMNISVQI